MKKNKSAILLSLSVVMTFMVFPSNVEAQSMTMKLSSTTLQEEYYVKSEENRLEKRAKDIIETRSESSPLTKDNKDDIVEYYAELYIPTEGCSLLDELPKDSDINYVKPKPKPKPKPKVVEQKSFESPKTPQANTTSTASIPEPSSEISEPVKISGKGIGMSDEERHWLEKLIEAEAAEEPYDGKVAVATTIANRIDSKAFPDTVMGVIKQNNGNWHQYSPWDDGAIYKRTPSEDTLKAIKEVFDEGNRNLPKETVYFAMKNIAFDNWMGRTRQHITTIHNHAFFSEYAK